MTVNPGPEGSQAPRDASAGPEGGEPGPAAPESSAPTPDRGAQPGSAAPGPTPVPKTVRHTRLGGIWLMIALGAVILVLLLVFILMNSQRVEINFYGAHWTVPVGVALLLAAALGVLLVIVPGAGRIIQLKRAARRLHRDREDLAGRLGSADEQPAAPAKTGRFRPSGRSRRR